MKQIKLSKIILVFSFGLYSFLVLLGNVTDYYSNFQFVKHVLSMDTIFPGNGLMWRSINNNILHHIFYIVIICTEAVITYFCFAGGVDLIKKINKNSEEFNNAKRKSLIGLTLAFVLWFVGFIAVGGEWFLMWQSEIWNGIEAAFRISAISLLLILFLSRTD